MTIKILPAPCWHIVFPDGTDTDIHGSPVAHYDTEAEVRADIADRERPELNVGRYEAPCVTVQCSDCGTFVEDWDTGWRIHFPDEKTWLEFLDPGEFVMGDDGKVRCEQDAARHELAKVGG